MNEPKVSVIVPVFNGEKTIKDCLFSVGEQKYSNYEIIVVDNNSSDKTKDAILECQKKIYNIKYIFEKNMSRGLARHIGEKMASGEIILMTDSDCQVPKNWIEKMTKPIACKKCDAVQGFEKPKTENNFWSYQQQLRVNEKWEKYIKNQEPIQIDTKNFAISKKALWKIGGTNPNIKALIDTELWIRFTMSGQKIISVEDAPVVHCHPEHLFLFIKKQAQRGYWCKKITSLYAEKIGLASFKKETGQDINSFFNIKNLLKSLKEKGVAYAFFDLIGGLAWRIGLIAGYFY